MKLKIEIDLGNSAMLEPGAVNLALQQVQVESNHAKPGDEGRIKDENGNTVGFWRVE